MVKQVGPAQGKPTTTLALEAAVIDWLPCARIPSWPGAPRRYIREAEDTFAVRPLRLRSELSPQPLRQLQQWRAGSHPARANLAPRVQPPLRPERLPPERVGLRPVFLTGAPKGARSGRGSAPAPRPPPSFTLTEESRYRLLCGPPRSRTGVVIVQARGYPYFRGVPRRSSWTTRMRSGTTARSTRSPLARPTPAREACTARQMAYGSQSQEVM